MGMMRAVALLTERCSNILARRTVPDAGRGVSFNTQAVASLLRNPPMLMAARNRNVKKLLKVHQERSSLWAGVCPNRWWLQMPPEKLRGLDQY